MTFRAQQACFCTPILLAQTQKGPILQNDNMYKHLQLKLVLIQERGIAISKVVTKSKCSKSSHHPNKWGKEIFQKKRTCHDIAQTPHFNSSQDDYSLKYHASKCFHPTKILGRVLQIPNRNLLLPPQLPISSHLLEGWTEGKYLGCHEDCKKEALETITTPCTGMQKHTPLQNSLPHLILLKLPTYLPVLEA